MDGMMKAVLVREPQNIELVEVNIPKLKYPDSVLVKMTAAGICGSDIHILHGTHPYVQYPRIIGHEGAGIVVSIGHAVKSLKEGDPVVIEAVEYCDQCYPCRIGRHNVCENLKVLGVHQSGTFEEYMVVPERYLYKYDPVLKPTEAVLAEPYTIGAQANSRAGTQNGDLVLVHGAGPIGLITCDIAHEAGAVCIVSDINEDRLALASKFGASFLINPAKQNLKEEVLKISSNMGANVIFDAAGAPGLIEQSIELASQAGRVVPMTFGPKPVPVNFGLVNKKELGIMGTRMECDRFGKVVELLPARRDRLNLLVSHVFSISEVKKAFDTASDPGTGACKVVFLF